MARHQAAPPAHYGEISIGGSRIIQHRLGRIEKIGPSADAAYIRGVQFELGDGRPGCWIKGNRGQAFLGEDARIIAIAVKMVAAPSGGKLAVRPGLAKSLVAAGFFPKGVIYIDIFIICPDYHY